MSSENEIKEFSITTGNGIEITFKFDNPLTDEIIQWLSDTLGTMTIDDLRDELNKKNLSYRIEMSQFGIKFAVPDSWGNEVNEGA